MSAPNLGADPTIEENVAPELEIHHGGADMPAPEQEEDLGASNIGAEETTKTPAKPKQHPDPSPKLPEQQPQPTSAKSAAPKQKEQERTPPPKRMPPQKTVPSAPPPQPHSSLPKTKQLTMPELMQPTPCKEGTSAAISLSPTPSLSTALALHLSAAALTAPATTSSAGDGFIAERTESGRSLGSIQLYADEWNVADMREVTSNPPLGQPHPAGPSALARRMYEAEAAVNLAKRVMRTADQTAKAWMGAYKKLLFEHRRLSDEHKLALADLKKTKKGAKEQIDALVKRVSEVEAEKTEREKEQAAKLKREQGEVAKLKAQLLDLQKTRESELQKYSEEQIWQDHEARQLRALLKENEQKATSAGRELQALQGKITAWTFESKKIQIAMTENFPESSTHAANAVGKYRLKRAELASLLEGWTIEDHLVAFSARVGPLRVLGVELFNAALQTFKVLWPGEESPRSPGELAERLMNSGPRLSAWRESAARAGADKALSFVLSWYEDINLEFFQHLRSNNKYVNEEEWIQKRKEVAYSFVQNIDVHNFVEGPSYAVDVDGEEEYEEETDEEAEEDVATGAEDAAPADLPSEGKADVGTETPSADVPSSADVLGPDVAKPSDADFLAP